MNRKTIGYLIEKELEKRGLRQWNFVEPLRIILRKEIEKKIKIYIDIAEKRLRKDNIYQRNRYKKDPETGERILIDRKGEKKEEDKRRKTVCESDIAPKSVIESIIEQNKGKKEIKKLRII